MRATTLVSFTILIVILCLIFSSCHNSYDNSEKYLDNKSVRLYNDSVFEILYRLPGELADSVENKINHDLRTAIQPLDRIACYLLKKEFREYDGNVDSIPSYYSKIDSIAKSNAIQLENYPIYYTVYMFGKNELHYQQNNIDSSKFLLLRLEQYSLSHHNIFLPDIYDKIAKYYFLHNEPEKTLVYTEKNFAINQNKSAIDSIKYNHKRIITLHELINKTKNKSFIDSIEKILLQSEKIYSRIPTDYAVEKWIFQGYSTLEFQKENYKKSAEYSEKIFLNDKKLGKELAINAHNIGSSYKRLNETKKAIQYYLQAISLAKKEKNNRILLLSYEDYSDLLISSGNNSDALKYVSLAHILSKELYNEKKEEEISKLEKDYSLKLKAKEISALLQENKFKEKTIKNRTLIFLIILITSCLLIYALFRQRILKKKLEKTKVEQQLFRLQMNPHFMFNAIAGIRGNILNDEKENAVIYLGKFSKLLRQLLENSNQEWISIKEEITFIHNYITIQQLRYQNKFDYTIQVDESIDTENNLIPTMILQPFVENSIEHGFFNIDYKGTINISINQYKSNMVKISIQDNGSGLISKVEKQIQSMKSKSMAMEIVKNRLDIISKETNTNSYYSQEEKNGVIVTLFVSLHKK